MSEIKYNQGEFESAFIPLEMNNLKLYLSTLSTNISDGSEALSEFESLYESFKSVLKAYRNLLENDLKVIRESVDKLAEEDSFLERLFRSMEIK